MARVIGVVSGKGGVGKTTLALNLGAALSHHCKKSVTLIDCNLTAPHSALHLGMYNFPGTLNKVLRGEAHAMDSTYSHFSGMKILPASLSISDLNGVDASRIIHAVRSIADRNDIIILDGSPGFGREAMGALRASEEILFVTTPHIPAVMDVVRFRDLAEDVKAKPLGIIMNMVGRDRYEMKKNEIEYLTDMTVISSVPYDHHVIKGMVNKVPFSVVHSGSRAGRAVRALAGNLIGERQPRMFDAIKAALGIN